MQPTRLALSLAAAAALTLAGCTQGKITTAAPAPAPTPSKQAQASPRPASPRPSPSASREVGGLPEICPLLSKAEVAALTGQAVTLMTDDGGGASTSKYCQWQLAQGQLTITVSLETREGFDVRNRQAAPVAGIGITAYSLSGHLFVWENGRDVDVYATPKNSDQANLAVERQAAAAILPKLG